MNTSTVTVKGQTTIPKDIRDYLRLKPHDTLLFYPDGPQVIIKPLRGSLSDLAGVFKPYHKGGPIDFKELRERTKRIVSRKILNEMR